MTTEVSEQLAGRPTRAMGQAQGETRRYSLYGLSVSSEFCLPVEPLETVPGVDAQLTIRYAGPEWSAPLPDGPAVAWAPCEVHGMDTLVSRGPGGVWIWHRSIGTCHVSPDIRRVDVYPVENVDEDALGLALVGPVVLYVLHRLGTPTLHATAVVTPSGTAAFLGPQGRGKSTMSASFLIRGATLLTDDALPLQCVDGVIFGMPGLPIMKLWRQTAECTLALGDGLPNLMKNCEKKLLRVDSRFSFAQRAERVQAVYMLARYDPIAEGRTDTTLTPVSGRDALALLLSQTSNRSYLLPADEARLLPVYGRLVGQAGVRVLGYPSGFEHQGAVYERVMADLGARG